MGASGKQIRPPRAGQRGFYPLDPSRLLAQVEHHLAAAQATPGAVSALIVPHAGYSYSGATAGAGFARVALAPIRRVLLLGPSHYHAFRGLALAPHTHFATPLGDVALDRAGRERLLAGDPLCQVRAAAHEEEHALEVELPFLQCLGAELLVLPIVCGGLALADCERLAPLLATEWTADTLLVVSSDFTHYGPRFDYQPFAVRDAPARLAALDGGALERIQAGDAAGFAGYVTRTGATICGHVPITLLLALAAARRGHPAAEQVAYTNSGTLTGDFTHSVSYAALVWPATPAVAP